jgi:hypothetical protein
MRIPWMAGWFAVVTALAAPGPDLARAIDLPAKAKAVRARGVPPGEVKRALKAAKDAGLGADEAADLLEAEEESARDGTIDNFGDFVQQKLSEGLRGRALAQAIREEHAARGIGGGPPEGKGGKGKGPDHEPGPPEGKGGKGGGPPDGKGPDDKGPDGDHGGGPPEGKGGKGKGH